MKKKSEIKIEYHYTFNPVQFLAGLEWHCKEIRNKLRNQANKVKGERSIIKVGET